VVFSRSMLRATRGRIGVAGLAVALVLGLAPGIAAAAPASRPIPPVPRDKSILVSAVTSHYKAMPAMPAWKAATVTWPSGTADITLAKETSATATAGSLPLNLSRTVAAQDQSTAHVVVAPQTTAKSLGLSGVVFTVQRTDGSTAPSKVKVGLDYTPFRDAFGGDWAGRLHLVELPSCALTTPNKPECRTETPVSSSNNAKAGMLTGDVSLPATARPATRAAEKTSAAAPMAFAAVAAADSSDGAGTYAATSLKASGAWQAGGSTDSFSWSYPITVPPVPGGLEPNIALTYSSQAMDGLNSSTNNQPSWIGDGWDYSPGYMERGYQSCHDNPAGATKTGDTCWSDNTTLTLSLSGQTNLLIRDDTTGEYHPQADSGVRVQTLTGAANGASNGEYFVVTTTDGTQYFFGYNQLPGWQSGNAATNSVLTEPVYATKAGQPCYNADFAQSKCTQGYRWNLDYVKDTHGNVVSYFYNKETNSYAADSQDSSTNTTATATYDRGSYLTKVQYGQRDGQVYSASPAAQVLFASSGRCDQASCDPSTLTKDNASHWPDVPFDLNCAGGAACDSKGPSFWSEYALQSIQTQALVGSTETNVDSWSLAHSFPSPTDSMTPALWLDSITHTGQDANGGGPSSPITLPAITFTGTPLSNRVNTGNGYSPIKRLRITGITTETGETINVGYSAPACGAGTPADPSQNTALCYPEYWTPQGHSDPIMDWFNKYIVTGVTEEDPTGAGSDDDIVTTYTPVGTPAWHYNDSPLTQSKQRTWDQWRGYQGMIVSTGSGTNDPRTKTQYTYFRGMDGDTLPNGGTRPASITDSRNDPAVTDSDQYAGSTYEKIDYNGDQVVSDTITTPWSSAPTATHVLPAQLGLPAQHSYFTGVASTKGYTPLADHTTRVTESDNTYDNRGRVVKVNDLGDAAVGSDDTCTTTTYADNTTVWIMDAATEATKVSVACTVNATLPGDAISDTLSFYDNATVANAAPTVGNVTKTQRATSYNGATPHFDTMTTAAFDQYGRITASTDPDNHSTTTAFTPATGAQPTSVAVTNSLSFTTTTTYDVARNLTLSTTDAAGYVTTSQYDALGRLTQVNKPGVNGAAMKYTYTISNTAPSVVDTYTLDPDGSYRLTEVLFDALLRARETQTQTPENGRLISDTNYNSDGWVSKATAPYYNADPVAPTYVEAQGGDVPSSTGTAYDGVGRKTTVTSYNGDSPTWSTTYTYGGNFVTVTPPAGASATTTFNDVFGRTTDLYVYHANVPTDPINDPAADYDHTSYTYYPNGLKHTVVDGAGNTWSYQYNLLGQQTSTTDPDAGTTTTTYDNAGLLLTSMDARGKQSTIKYDNGGRKTGMYDTTGNQAPSATNQTAGWTYDTPAKGYPSTTTSISNGDRYTQTVVGYNAFGLPSSVNTKLTGEGTTVFPSAGITTSYKYSTTGYQVSQTDSGVDGLPTEEIQIGYDNLGEPTSLNGKIAATTGVPSWTYVNALGYSHYGQPVQYTMTASNGPVVITNSYDEQTRALTDVQTNDTTAASITDDTGYSFTAAGISKGAGLVTSTVDKQNGTSVVDTQCYRYDYATRLSAAWTATDSCGNTPQTGNSASVGGPVPYWQSWSYDAAGNRASQVDHDVTGNTANDTRTVYNYPAAGSSTDQPHTLSNTTSTGPQAAANTATYHYDASGNTTQISGGATGDQSLTWNDQGQLANDTTATGGASYVYDTSGHLIVRRDPGRTTIFVGDEQLTLDTTTNGVSASRYYSIGGATVAMRTTLTTNPQILVPDRQGTNQLTIDASSHVVTRRQFLPFGSTRGTAPTSWPGDRGYVGGTPDQATQLENLGAREYNPANGRFLSLDPAFEAAYPNAMGGYDYAANNPVTDDDASGLIPHCPDGDCSHGLNGNPTGKDTGPLAPVWGTTGSDDWCNPFCGDKTMSTDPIRKDPHFQQITQEMVNAWWNGIPKPPPPIQRPGKAAWEFPQRGETPDIDPAIFFGMLAGVLSGIAEGAGCEVGTLGFGTPFCLLAAAREGYTHGEEVHDLLEPVIGEDSCANSFAADTRVLMADGSQKPIQDVKIGDAVANADPDAVAKQLHKVTAVHVTDTDTDFTSLSVMTATGAKTITVTAHHLFWDSTKHVWTNAANLKPGDKLDTGGDGTAIVLFSWHFTSSIRTYNLTIEDLHTYYVIAGSTPLLVHNAGNKNVGKCPNDLSLDHGKLGEWVTEIRLRDEGYTDITEQVTFTNSQGLPFRADFVAKDPNGNWTAIESKMNTGGYTANQLAGYPELETTGARLATDLSDLGMPKGSIVKMPVETDRWWCPKCH
jgi:RHS repeat-associated protein